MQVRAPPPTLGRTPVRAARELHAGVRSAGDVSSEEVRPAASGRLEYAIDERALRFSAPKNRVADDSRRFRPVGCRREDHGRVCVRARARALGGETRSQPLEVSRDSATPACGGAETETKKEGKTAREREREGWR